MLLLGLLLSFIHRLRWRSQVELLDGSEHESRHEIRVLSVARVLLCVEVIVHMQDAEDMDVGWQALIQIWTQGLFEVVINLLLLPHLCNTWILVSCW